MEDSQPDQAVNLEAHGLRWNAAAKFAAVLPELDIEKVRHPERFTKSDLIKDNRVRTVVCIPNPANPAGPRLYVKRFKFPDTRRKLKCMLQATQAWREWKTGRDLVRNGIPTCRVLAVAERRVGLLPREAFLINEEVPRAVPLARYLASGEWRRLERGRARALAAELAELAARLLRAGYWHRDFHAENLLIAPQNPVGRRFFVLDLHSIFRGHPPRRLALRMLAMLALSTERQRIPGLDRLRFLHAFLCRWKGITMLERGMLRRWNRRASAALESLRRGHIRSRTRRCVVESTRFTRQRAAGFRIFRQRDFLLQAALSAVEAHEKAVSGQEGVSSVRKAERRTQVSICDCGPFGAVCVKAFLRSSVIARIKDMFRLRGRARAAWIAHRACQVRGLPTADGLALLEARCPLSGKPDYLIVEALELEGNLREIAFSRVLGSPQSAVRRISSAEKRELSRAVAKLFRLLVEKQVRHPDLKPSNILVGRAGDTFRLWLADLDRVRFERHWGREDWIRALSQCDAGLPSRVTLLDRMRCLRECGGGRWSAAERKQIARAVHAESLTRRPAATADQVHSGAGDCR